MDLLPIPVGIVGTSRSEAGRTSGHRTAETPAYRRHPPFSQAGGAGRRCRGSAEISPHRSTPAVSCMLALARQSRDGARDVSGKASAPSCSDPGGIGSIPLAAKLWQNRPQSLIAFRKRSVSEGQVMTPMIARIGTAASALFMGRLPVSGLTGGGADMATIKPSRAEPSRAEPSRPSCVFSTGPLSPASLPA